MKMKPLHVGNVVLALDRDPIDPRVRLFMGLKPPQNAADYLRIRARIGCGRWTPIGGGSEDCDKTPRHSAQRELLQESGEVWDLPLVRFKKVAMLESFVTGDCSWKEALFVWQVHIYTVIIPDDKVGAFKLCSEYEKVAWYPIKGLPWNDMLSSDRLWIPEIFRGKRFIVQFLYQHEIGGTMADYRFIPRSF